MIQKYIHYIWLGDRQPSIEICNYMSTWKKLEKKGYNIIRWDNKCLDRYTLPEAIEMAYKYKKYAFVADWLRLKILYEYGGIYLDTDVEVRRDFSKIICRNDVSLFLGFIFDVSLGTAVIGAEKNNNIIKKILEQYETAEYKYDVNNKQFTLKFDFIPEMYMVNNNDLFTGFFIKNIPNFHLNGKKQLCGESNEVLICPKEYFEGYSISLLNNYTIHHCCGSWRNADNVEENKMRKNLKKIYVLRWIKDKYSRKRKKNLPFEQYKETK